MSQRKELIALTWTERLTLLNLQWAAMYGFGVETSGRGDKGAGSSSTNGSIGANS